MQEQVPPPLVRIRHKTVSTGRITLYNKEHVIQLVADIKNGIFEIPQELVDIALRAGHKLADAPDDPAPTSQPATPDADQNSGSTS